MSALTDSACCGASGCLEEEKQATSQDLVHAKGKKKRNKKKGGGGKGPAVQVGEGEEEEPECATDPQAAADLSNAVTGANDTPAAVIKKIKQLQMQELMKQRNGSKEPEEHKFWDTQPVPKLGSSEETGHGPIEEKTVADVRQEPYNMPAGFEWCDVDVLDRVQLEEVYQLLNENYVEDDDNMFRFDYSVDFLLWALTPPGFKRQFHAGVRNQKTGKLFGFITAVPARMRVYENTLDTVEINFLCVHKKLRSKRLAPVLIKEITRRVNCNNIWQAVYTAGVVLPKPVASCRYHHRSLNPKKLIDVGFSRLSNRMTMARTIKLYKLPEQPHHDTLRAMVAADVPSACALLNKYLAQFKMAPVMDEADFAHWLLPREGVINSYVIANEQGEVTDMCSYYHLPSTVIGHAKHSTLHAAYAFYNVATTMPLQELMRDALILARAGDMDVFNALDLMDNTDFLEGLKFGIGDGHLQYYMYNWRCPDMKQKEVGLVLL
ncbi:unnamed protein product [Chrysoparadoxa australica]